MRLARVPRHEAPAATRALVEASAHVHALSHAICVHMRQVRRFARAAIVDPADMQERLGGAGHRVERVVCPRAVQGRQDDGGRCRPARRRSAGRRGLSCRDNCGGVRA